MEPNETAQKSVAGLGWLLIAASMVVNVWLAYRVGEFRFGAGAAQAQADFELFMLLLTFGAPVALFAFIFLVAIALSNLRAKNVFVSMAKNPAVLLCAINVLVPVCLLAYLLSIR